MICNMLFRGSKGGVFLRGRFKSGAEIQENQVSTSSKVHILTSNISDPDKKIDMCESFNNFSVCK